ncbi:hypothetical protein C5S31_04640 [ANME-1 cluster archaeon GoMg2]|nr:hypothetical protein [ANME-1 cluster archaeon GoMg2]
MKKQILDEHRDCPTIDFGHNNITSFVFKALFVFLFPLFLDCWTASITCDMLMDITNWCNNVKRIVYMGEIENEFRDG